MSDIQARGKTVQRVSDEAAKWIDWPEFLNCVKQLKAECTPIGKSNQQRSHSAIATSIQRYLIFAFFSAIPERPRTVRELELGHALVKRDEVWYLELGPEDFKTGATYLKLGEKRVISDRSSAESPLPAPGNPDIKTTLNRVSSKAA
jgi:hypothetical protein